VTTHDAKKRLEGFKYFDDIVLCEIVRYGIYNRPEMIAPLSELYQKLVTQKPNDEKLELYRHIKGLVEHTSLSTNALLPFIAEESSRAVVSTAVIDYASFGPLTDDDPMKPSKGHCCVD
jgi:hypothetical protein